MVVLHFFIRYFQTHLCLVLSILLNRISNPALLCAGLGHQLVSEDSMHKHGANWMMALKAAVEGRA